MMGRPVRAIDRFGVLFFIVFLILPSLFWGLTRQRPFWTLRHTNFLYDAASLFPKGVKNIPVFYLQGSSGPSEDWITLDEAEYFPISRGLGHRTRFTRFCEIYLLRNGLVADLAGSDLGAWLIRRHRTLHPNEPPFTRVRVLRAPYTVGMSHDASGEWKTPPLDSHSPDDLETVFEHRHAG